jgi:YidC/Oxa1 family membrane protein insertase
MTKVVELRQAHFFWLPDLSASDPYHILPILMVATSFLAQFYTPSPGVDPQQQKMMAFVMPIFSGYLTWQYASGLALYWNIGNLVMIIQQQVMNRTSLGREMKELAAKRARRKVAAPKPGQRTATTRTIQGRK